MSETKTARRYAKAFFDLVLEGDTLDVVAAELKSIRDITRQSTDFEHFLADPMLSIEKRSAILHEIFKDSIEPSIYQFILFLEEKRRINLLDYVLLAFNELYLEYKGILEVKIISASELTSEQALAINTKLAAKFSKQIESEISIDRSLLGGFRLIVGDEVLDFSVIAQLNRIKHNIINA